MVQVLDIITAATYNTLQSRIANIVGNGFADSGYGQALSSSQVSTHAIVTALDMDNLRSDVNKARVHQTGSASTLGDIAVHDVIAADTSGGVTTKGINDYSAEISSAENDKFLCDATQASVEAAISSTRTQQWNGTITHTFTATFASENARRYFFNAGGEIRFQAQLSNGNGAKDADWATMLNNMGTIKFAYGSTTATGSGTPTAIGNYQLTSSFQTVFTKNGSSVYAENAYVVKARSQATNQIEFKIEFQDNDVGEPPPIPIDENVTGTITSSISQRRASGSYVNTAGPNYANVTVL